MYFKDDCKAVKNLMFKYKEACKGAVMMEWYVENLAPITGHINLPNMFFCFRSNRR